MFLAYPLVDTTMEAPLIGIWVRLLRVPVRLMFPAALFFVAVRVFSSNNSLF